MKELNICRPLKWKKLNSGSYYSYVKVSKQDEFDYLLCPTLVQCRIEQHSSSPNYCRVFVTNRKNLPLDFRELLGPDDELFPSKFKEYAFKVFDLCLKEMENRRLVKMSTGSTCPAYTVEYKYGARNKYIYDIDWIPCLGVQDCPDSYMEWKTKKLTDEEKSDCKILVVPKDLASNDENLELWRLSYSTFEKKIIREKCKPDDRRVIRILKNILTDENDHKIKRSSIFLHFIYQPFAEY
ncbi:unnamed protein product [Acanthosepion pharaonis]|uniref:Mab-21-like nucleotidyltransferase domain-containing protein n=1 Tax=Acanthosepion pharaonis TaxID=158019 RepID=A0A812CI46_ACAPH|nr:unnamed protein product [Sepia pharaonis]